MPAGRKAIPTHLKLLRGNPGRRDRHITRENLSEYEPTSPPLDEVPEPPSFITGYAADEWRKVARELHNLRLLTSLDLAALAGYCNAYARWRNAVEVMAEQSVGSGTRGLMVSTMYGPRRNPLIAVANEAAMELLRFAAEFGMSPAARSRIRLSPRSSDGGKFSGLLGAG
jgi:P27 family predicted phage terminase small subunit